MKLGIVHQLNGNFYIEDVDDEAPMIKVTFCNEFVGLKDEIRRQLANDLYKSLIDQLDQINKQK